MDQKTSNIQLFNAAGAAGVFVIIFGLHAVLRRVTSIPFEWPLAAVWALAFSALAWRRMDEAAREAHKNAWYWGGFTGLAIALVGLIATLRLDPNPAFLQRYSGQPVWLMVDGACLAISAALIGFGCAWSVWWLRRR